VYEAQLSSQKEDREKRGEGVNQSVVPIAGVEGHNGAIQIEESMRREEVMTTIC